MIVIKENKAFDVQKLINFLKSEEKIKTEYFFVYNNISKEIEHITFEKINSFIVVSKTHKNPQKIFDEMKSVYEYLFREFQVELNKISLENLEKRLQLFIEYLIVNDSLSMQEFFELLKEKPKKIIRNKIRTVNF